MTWLANEYQDEPDQVDVIDPGDRSKPESWSAYVFHHGYSHTVYERPGDLFETREAAVAEIARRRAAARAKEDAEFDVWWDKNRDAIFASARKGLTPAPEV
jgi:hypothetical protein